jgi:hypothetical protein
MTLEIDDEVLRALIRLTPNPISESDKESAVGMSQVEDGRIELPASWRQVDEQRGVVYTWGDDRDVYDPFRIYEADIPTGTARLAIGRCERARTFGEDRVYYIVALIGPAGGVRAISEFLATDDYDETHDVIAVIKGKDRSGRQFDSPEELPAVYSGWPTIVYRTRVDYPGAYSKQALVCNEQDHEIMLNHAWAQIRLRGLDDG